MTELTKKAIQMQEVSESVQLSVNEASPAQKTEEVSTSPRKGVLAKSGSKNILNCFGLIGEHNKWRVIQGCIWVFLVGLITFTPVIMRFSFLDIKTHEQLSEKYAPPTVHCISFCISIIVGISISTIMYGRKGLGDCFALYGILWQVPVSFGYAGSEAFALFAMRTADPIMYAVVHKMRLLETAIMTRIFLRRHISAVQWTICFCVTCCVLAFVLYTIHDGERKADALGPILLIVNITLSVACSIYADWVYKKIGYPLPIQMAQGRFSAAVGSGLIAIVFISIKGWWKYGWTGGPQGGWDGFVLLLMCWNILRDWTTCFVLLHLDALWKALAGSTAVATTYAADVIIFGKRVVPTLVCLVAAIVLAVSIYALVKRMEIQSKKDKLKMEEYEQKIKLLELGSVDAWKEKI